MLLDGGDNLRPEASRSPSAYFDDLNSWLTPFINNLVDDNYSNLTAALTDATFYANEANLVNAAAVLDWRRTLFNCPGISIDKLSIETWAIVLISVITALHVIGLMMLAIYSISYPTWTDTLDAFAMFRLGGSLAEDKIMKLPQMARIG